jgi:putative nucleotidyltransferase with HDIG domain
MNSSTATLLQRKISDLRNLPAMPTVLQSLGECLTGDAGNVNIDRITELISYDKSLAAQCLRMANSVLFRRRAEVESLRAAIVSLGVWRIRDLVYSCALPTLLSGSETAMAPPIFWRHALGTALISQHLAQRLAIPNIEKVYLAGLLHDLGVLVNSILFREEFIRVLQLAESSETPLYEVEMQVLGFSHCDSGRILADLWKLPEDVSAVIELHHHPAADNPGADITCTVYLADLLCRLRGLGYGYYEAREFDLPAEPAWRLLQNKYPSVAELDLALFTFELDEHAVQVCAMVDAIFSSAAVSH